MSDTNGTIIAAFSAVVGSVVTNLFGLMKQSSEEKRWYGQYFLEPKLKALRRLHNVLVANHYSMLADHNVAYKRALTPEDYFKTVEPKKLLYLSAMTQAYIYLDAESRKMLERVLGSFRAMDEAIFHFASGNADNPDLPALGATQDLTTPEWKEYVDSFESARARLGDLLNPRNLLDEIQRRGNRP